MSASAIFHTLRELLIMEPNRSVELLFPVPENRRSCSLMGATNPTSIDLYGTLDAGPSVLHPAAESLKLERQII